MRTDKLFGFYRAEVISNSDTKKSGRVQIKLLPYMEETIEQDSFPWAIPVFPYGGSKDKGFCFIPDVGDIVIVFFENGNILNPWYMGAAGFKDAVPEEVQDTPENKVIKTKKHTIEINDKEESITIKTNENDNSVVLNSDGEVILKGTITLNTGDAIAWTPCIIPNCLFTSAPHGGIPAGINKLKGK